MTTVMPPAPPAPTPPVSSPPPRRPSAAARAVAIVMIVLGGIVLLATVGTVALSVALRGAIHSESRDLVLSDVDRIDVDVSGGSLDISYADVDRATLSVDSTRSAADWTLAQTGRTLTVSTPDGPRGIEWLFGGYGSARLILPRALATTPVDAALTVAGGSLTVDDGAFRALSTETDAGSLEVSGTAATLKTDTNAGDTRLELADVARADLSVSAGRLTAELSGDAPRRVTTDVSAGSLDLEVPPGDYAVTSDVSAGSFDNRIGSTPTAANTIHVEVSAGSVTLDRSH